MGNTPTIGRRGVTHNRRFDPETEGNAPWETDPTQIATRTGDDGTTGLGDNTRVSKASGRPHAMGMWMSWNSHIGLPLLCESLPADMRELLIDVQHQLFNLGASCPCPAMSCSSDDGLLQLDNALARRNAELPRRAANSSCPPVRAAACQARHVCRTASARRAERAVVAQLVQGPEDPWNCAAPRQYLNRLSDLLFVPRVLNRPSMPAARCTGRSERLARQNAT